MAPNSSKSVELGQTVNFFTLLYEMMPIEERERRSLLWGRRRLFLFFSHGSWWTGSLCTCTPTHLSPLHYSIYLSVCLSCSSIEQWTTRETNREIYINILLLTFLSLSLSWFLYLSLSLLFSCHCLCLCSCLCLCLCFCSCLCFCLCSCSCFVLDLVSVSAFVIVLVSVFVLVVVFA